MNLVVRGAWTTALRSREYPQGRRNLRTNAGFCCLGVLCDLAERAGIIESQYFGDEDTGMIYYYDGRSGTLPDKVMEWAGLDSDNPAIGNTSLILLNDEGASFEMIADLIERNL